MVCTHSMSSSSSPSYSSPLACYEPSRAEEAELEEEVTAPELSSGVVASLPDLPVIPPPQERRAGMFAEVEVM